MFPQLIRCIDLVKDCQGAGGGRSTVLLMEFVPDLWMVVSTTPRCPPQGIRSIRRSWVGQQALGDTGTRAGR